MAGTTTPRLGLYKPTPGTTELVDVSKLNTAMDIIDAQMNMSIATSGAHDSSPFNRQIEAETDTKRVKYWDDESAVWRQFLTQGSTYVAGATGSTADVRLRTSATPASNRALSVAQTTDTQDRHSVDYDGTMLWGPGNAGLDTNLYRSGANTLKTDDSLEVSGTVSVTGGIPLVGPGTTTGARTEQLQVNGTTKVDTDLFFVAVSGRTYVFDVGLFHQMSTTGDIQVDFTFPSGRLRWGALGSATALATSGTSTGDNDFRARMNTSSPSDALSFGSMTDGPVFAKLSGTFVATGSGTVRLRASQLTNAGNSFILQDSFIHVTCIG